MGLWDDIATYRGPTPNHGGPMVEHRGVVVHIAEGSFEGTISWQMNPDSDVSSHFVVAADGRIAQMLDTDVTAWTQQAGNGHWLSVENEGRTPGPLTAAQLDANALILAKAHHVYGVPLELADDPAGRGLGHHSMGTAAEGWHGATWGHEDCPGPNIKAQKPDIVSRASGTKPAQEDDDMKSIWYVQLPDGRIARDDGTLYTVIANDVADRRWLDDVYYRGGRVGETSPLACDGPWRCDIRNHGLNMSAEPYLTLLHVTGSVDVASLAGTAPGAPADVAAIAKAVNDEMAVRLAA